ncbi:MAG TPA: hemolysin family protein [Chitinophagaceae bacterium]|nr:hemolysin family protein [Chitinophagaceae bacterium]
MASVLIFGFFTGMEAAFAGASKLSIELSNKKGNLSGKLMTGYLEHPERFLGGSLIVINLILVACGILVTEVSRPFWANLFSGSLDTPLVKLLAESLATGLILIIFGELLPGTLFRSRADYLFSLFIIPQSVFLKICYPVSAFFIYASKGLLKFLFDVRLGESQQVFSRFISIPHIQDPQHVTESQELNAALLEKALSLPYVKVRQCMIPRNEIEALDILAGLPEARNRFIITQLSKILVYEGSIDNILGYLHHLDMFSHTGNLRELIHPILAVPETMSATDLLNKFTKGRRSIAWVVDEFGGTAGIVTLEDLLEEIFGEIRDEHDTEELTEKHLSEKEYIFSGRLEIDYLNGKYGFGLPNTGSETLSGFIISSHEAIPRVKERIIIKDFEFDILGVTETRIETVKMRVLK